MSEKEDSTDEFNEVEEIEVDENQVAEAAAAAASIRKQTNPAPVSHQVGVQIRTIFI